MHPPNGMSVDAAFKQGMAQYQNGALKPAAILFSQIIQAAPQHAHAHQMLGLIAFQTGQYGPAVKAMTEAVRLQPNNGHFLTNFTEVLRKAGQPVQAVAIGKSAVHAAPDNASAHSNLGLAYYDHGDLLRAEASQQRALALTPGFGPALNNLGSIARDNGDPDAAIAFYRQALHANPHYAETANNLIAVLLETDNIDDARALTKDRLRAQPKDSDLQRCSGRIALIDGDLDTAEAAFRTAIALNDSQADNFVGLSQVLYEKNHPTLALLEAEKAQRLDPDNAMACHQIAAAKANLGDIDAGFAFYNKTLALKPDMVASQIAIGHLLMEQGDFKAARAAFQATTTSQDPISGHVALARLEKMTADHPSFQALAAALPTADTMLPAKAVTYHYALGKAYEDQEQHDRAFDHFAKGAATKRGLIRYDPAVNDAATDAIITTFDPAFIKTLRASAIASDQAIFVVGMPRSGTTLTEAILDAHPQVFGAGELSTLQALFGQQTGDLAGSIAALSATDLTRNIKTYVQTTQKYAPDMPHIVDKMPANFQMIGLIHALMPNAKIVHIARNPFDTCLSCFTRVFERSQLHSYDQVELGRYFNNYLRIMEHWQATLPKGAFHTLHYENLVDDFETQARAIIAHCGLAWDDACLAFHQGKRRVRTASVQQVRQPLYASSKAKWKAYEAQLKPLIDTIGDRRITF